MASRLNYTHGQEYVEHDDGINNVLSDLTERPNKVVIVDYDFILHQSLYSGKNEITGERNPEYTEADLEFLYGKVTEATLKMLNSVEKYFNILNCYMFVKSKTKGFRKEIYPLYKSHRPAPNPLINKLYEYAKIAHQTIEADDTLEADDMISIVSNKIDNTGIIVSIDKDMKIIPSIIYNPNKDYWIKVSEREALYNFYSQLVIGDSADKIPGAFKIGEAWVKKNLHTDMSIEEYEAKVLEAYIKAAKGNVEQAKFDMELNRQLIQLKKE